MIIKYFCTTLWQGLSKYILEYLNYLTKRKTVRKRFFYFYTFFIFRKSQICPKLEAAILQDYCCSNWSRFRATAGHTSIHPYIHTSIHSYIHTSIHPYIHTFIQPYIHTSIHPYIHTTIHPYIHTSLHQFNHPKKYNSLLIYCHLAEKNQTYCIHPSNLYISV